MDRTQLIENISKILINSGIDQDLDLDLDLYLLPILKALENTDMIPSWIVFVREPSNYDETYIDAVYSVDAKDIGYLYIHLEEIQWFEAEDFDTLVEDIISVIDRINDKVAKLDILFANS